MRKNLLFNCGLAAALLLGTAASVAAQSAPSDSQQGMFEVLPGTRQVITGGDRQQVQIAREVRHELAMLPYYSIFDDLKYRVDGSTVTLGGSAITVGLKRDAESAVKGVEGVTRVVNQIQELPPMSSDQRIREQAARRIFSFGGLSRYAWEASPTIHIIVNGGHLSLEGVVDSEADKDAAGIQANSVPGVFSVQNNLQIADKRK